MIALQSGSGDSVSDESRSGVGVSLFSNACESRDFLAGTSRQCHASGDRVGLSSLPDTRCTVRYTPTVTEIRWWLEVRPPSAATRCGFYTGISNNTFTTHAGQGTVPVLATARSAPRIPAAGDWSRLWRCIWEF